MWIPAAAFVGLLIIGLLAPPPEKTVSTNAAATTAAKPTTAAPVQTTVPLPVEGTPCLPRGAQTRGFACVRSSGGDIWFAAPFALPKDIINVLQVEPTAEDTAKVQDMLVLASRLTDISPVGGLTYWCIIVTMRNQGTDAQWVYPPHWAIINPSGVVEVATVPKIIDRSLLLRTIQIKPGQSETGLVCFDVPLVSTGRMSVAYLPDSFSGPDRALYYFDR